MHGRDKVREQINSTILNQVAQRPPVGLVLVIEQLAGGERPLYLFGAPRRSKDGTIWEAVGVTQSSMLVATGTKPVKDWRGVPPKEDGGDEDGEIGGHVYPLSTLRRSHFSLTRRVLVSDDGWREGEGRWAFEFDAGTVTFGLGEAPSEATREQMAGIVATAAGRDGVPAMNVAST